ncbi:MAG: ABC transporter permease, partial [Steroidobacteraceae bacterium]
MSSLLSALRRAARRLWKAPAFTLPAIVTLGLGIGATAATLTLVNAVVLRSLPYPDPDRLVSLRHTVRGDSSGRSGLSDGLYLHYLKYSKAFDDIGLY